MRRVSRATGAAAIAFSLIPGVAFQVEEVRIHLSAAGGAGDLTISLDALTGADYDAVFLTQDMTLVIDLVWQPVRPHNFVAGDGLAIAWANAGTKTYGLEVIWSAMP